MRALYAYAGAGLAVTTGLILVVATRSQLNSEPSAPALPAVIDSGLAPTTPPPAPAPAPAQPASFVYSGKLPHYVIKTDWKELAEALPAEAEATSYFLSPIHDPVAQTGDATDVAAHPAALVVDIGEDAPPEATGDTRIGD